MKNYLFAPFKNDDDKIEEFNAVINALNYVVDAEETHHHESALHGLRVFIGRLESYYDVIITHLRAEKDALKCRCDELKAEIKLLSCDDIDDCGCVIPMEYKQEARDYMNHNPKVKKVYFFMVADDCIGDDGYAQNWSCFIDDAVAVINNE